MINKKHTETNIAFNFEKNKKVMFVVGNINFLISHRLELYQKLEEIGNEMIVVCGNKKIKKEYIHKLKEINFIQLDFSSSEKNPIKIISSLIKIIKIIKKNKPCKIHTVSPIGNLLGGVSSIFFKKIHLITAISGRGTLYIDQKLKTKLLKSIFSFCEYIYLNKRNSSTITQNSFDYADVKRKQFFLKKNTLIMGSGVNLLKFIPKKTQKIYDFCFVGRLTMEKGIVDFIEAASFAQKENNDLKFVVIGEMPLEDLRLCHYLESQFAAKTFINFVGFKTNLSDYYNKSKILCLPSKREGMPRVILEASSCGIPSIAYNVIGCNEAIVNGVNGFLVNEVHPNDLGKKMVEVINRDDLSKLGKTSRTHAEKKFSIESVISSHLKLYESI